jgi:putative aminopeptidase FrvX
LTSVGGFAWGSIEGENCLVHTRHNGTIRGSLLPHEASVHVYENVRDGKRDNLSMEVAWTNASPPLKRHVNWVSKWEITFLRRTR